MVDIDFSNIQLNPTEKKLLRKMNRKKSIPYNEDYDYLIRRSYAEYTEYTQDEMLCQIPVENEIAISEIGRAYLKFKKKEFIKDFLFDIINLVIALSALVLSIISLVIQ